MTLTTKHQRTRLLQSLSKQIKIQDLLNQHNMEKFFHDKGAFLSAIQAKVIPSLITFKTNRNKGSGFAFAPHYITSNAHILSSASAIKETTVLSSTHEYHLDTNTHANFIRPQNAHSPDITVIETQQRHQSCLNLHFPGNRHHNESIFFFIDTGHDNNIVHCQQSHQHPTRYKCINGSANSGVSGAPMIEARVILSGQTPQWEFCARGIVFARHESDHTSVFTIELKPELEQIRQILYDNENQDRQRSLVQASRIINRSDQLTHQHEKQLLHCTQQAQRGMQLFLKGYSFQRMPAMEHLQPLYYTNLVAVKLSLLIKQNRKQDAIKAKMNKHGYGKGVSEDQLRIYFDQLISMIANINTLPLQRNTSATTFMKNELFRLDIEGGVSGPWKLSIEDNIHDKNNKPLKHNGKALSSVFAKVKYPKKNNCISGSLLAALLLHSSKYVLSDNEPDFRRCAVIQSTDANENHSRRKNKKGKVKKAMSFSTFKKQKKKKQPACSNKNTVACTEFAVTLRPDGYVIDSTLTRYNSPSKHHTGISI